MPTRGRPETGEQSYRRPDDDNEVETRRLLDTLQHVFSTLREQIQADTPTPRQLTGNAKIAVDIFNDILAGLKLEPRLPVAVVLHQGNVSATEINIVWTDTAGNADGYRVQRCTGHNCEDFAEVALLPAVARSFRDTEVSEGHFFRYRVDAFDARGDSLSNVIGVTAQTVEVR